MTITEFLLARIAEGLTEARRLHDRAEEHAAAVKDVKLLGRRIPGWYEWRGIMELARRTIADLEAKRRIVEFHERWPVLLERPPTFERTASRDPHYVAFTASQQIAWLTEREYRARFGDEPPTAPVMREFAALWSEHPDYDQDWRVAGNRRATRYTGVMSESTSLTPVDGVVYTGTNREELLRWADDHGFAVDESALEPMTLFEAVGDPLELSVRSVTPVREPAPIHYRSIRYDGLPLERVQTLCGRLVLDALTGDPVLTVSRGHQGKVTCAECLARLERAKYDLGGRHPSDAVMSRMLEEIQDLRREFNAAGFPPSSDMLELRVGEYTNKIVARCLICSEDLPGEIASLSEALVVWREHRRRKST